MEVDESATSMAATDFEESKGDVTIDVSVRYYHLLN